MVTAWDELVTRLGAPPFLRPGWTGAWLDAFAPEGRVRVSTVWDGDELVALAPWLLEARTARTPTNEHTPAWGFLVRDEAAAQDLVADVLETGPDRVLVSLADVADPTTRSVVAALHRGGLRPLVDDEVASPYSAVIGTWDEFEQRLSTRRRSQLRRHARRLADEGRLEHLTAPGTEDLDALLAEGFAVEASGWKGARGTAINSDPRTARFYTAIARWAGARGDLRLDLLRLDGHAIAFQYTLWHGSTVWYLKAGYDEALGRWSPGTLLVRRTLRDAVEDPAITCFEWLGGAERYKTEWSDGVRTRRSTSWYAPTPRGRVDRALRVSRRRAAATAKARLPAPAVERLRQLRR